MAFDNSPTTERSLSASVGENALVTAYVHASKLGDDEEGTKTHYSRDETNLISVHLFHG